jgi:catechol 2,3-dioxygenase-like lactoylglutathione lyase family enzyme
MQIRHVIIKVDEQDKALSFYTSIVGFVKRLDLPIGRVRWLTVYSREGAAGVELVAGTEQLSASADFTEDPI